MIPSQPPRQPPSPRRATYLNTSLWSLLWHPQHRLPLLVAPSLLIHNGLLHSYLETDSTTGYVVRRSLRRSTLDSVRARLVAFRRTSSLTGPFDCLVWASDAAQYAVTSRSLLTLLCTWVKREGRFLNIVPRCSAEVAHKQPTLPLGGHRRSATLARGRRRTTTRVSSGYHRALVGYLRARKRSTQVSKKQLDRVVEELQGDVVDASAAADAGESKKDHETAAQRRKSRNGGLPIVTVGVSESPLGLVHQVIRLKEKAERRRKTMQLSTRRQAINLSQDGADDGTDDSVLNSTPLGPATSRKSTARKRRRRSRKSVGSLSARHVRSRTVGGNLSSRREGSRAGIDGGNDSRGISVVSSNLVRQLPKRVSSGRSLRPDVTRRVSPMLAVVANTCVLMAYHRHDTVGAGIRKGSTAGTATSTEAQVAHYIPQEDQMATSVVLKRQGYTLRADLCDWAQRYVRDYFDLEEVIGKADERGAEEHMADLVAQCEAAMLRLVEYLDQAHDVVVQEMQCEFVQAADMPGTPVMLQDIRSASLLGYENGIRLGIDGFLVPKTLPSRESSLPGQLADTIAAGLEEKDGASPATSLAADTRELLASGREAPDPRPEPVPRQSPFFVKQVEDQDSEDLKDTDGSDGGGDEKERENDSSNAGDRDNPTLAEGAGEQDNVDGCVDTLPAKDRTECGDTCCKNECTGASHGSPHPHPPSSGSQLPLDASIPATSSPNPADLSLSRRYVWGSSVPSNPQQHSQAHQPLNMNMGEPECSHPAVPSSSMPQPFLDPRIHPDPTGLPGQSQSSARIAHPQTHLTQQQQQHQHQHQQPGAHRHYPGVHPHLSVPEQHRRLAQYRQSIPQVNPNVFSTVPWRPFAGCKRAKSARSLHRMPGKPGFPAHLFNHQGHPQRGTNHYASAAHSSHRQTTLGTVSRPLSSSYALDIDHEIQVELEAERALRRRNGPPPRPTEVSVHSARHGPMSRKGTPYSAGNNSGGNVRVNVAGSVTSWAKFLNAPRCNCPDQHECVHNLASFDGGPLVDMSARSVSSQHSSIAEGAPTPRCHGNHSHRHHHHHHQQQQQQQQQRPQAAVPPLDLKSVTASAGHPASSAPMVALPDLRFSRSMSPRISHTTRSHPPQSPVHSAGTDFDHPVCHDETKQQSVGEHTSCDTKCTGRPVLASAASHSSARSIPSESDATDSLALKPETLCGSMEGSTVLRYQTNQSPRQAATECGRYLMGLPHQSQQDRHHHHPHQQHQQPCHPHHASSPNSHARPNSARWPGRHYRVRFQAAPEHNMYDPPVGSPTGNRSVRVAMNGQAPGSVQVQYHRQHNPFMPSQHTRAHENSNNSNNGGDPLVDAWRHTRHDAHLTAHWKQLLEFWQGMARQAQRDSKILRKQLTFWEDEPLRALQGRGFSQFRQLHRDWISRFNALNAHTRKIQAELADYAEDLADSASRRKRLETEVKSCKLTMRLNRQQAKEMKDRVFELMTRNEQIKRAARDHMTNLNDMEQQLNQQRRTTTKWRAQSRKLQGILDKLKCPDDEVGGLVKSGYRICAYCDLEAYIHPSQIPEAQVAETKRMDSGIA